MRTAGFCLVLIAFIIIILAQMPFDQLMKNYKTFSMIQVLLLFTAGISLVVHGYDLKEKSQKENSNKN